MCFVLSMFLQIITFASERQIHVARNDAGKATLQVSCVSIQDWIFAQDVKIKLIACNRDLWWGSAQLRKSLMNY